ncbi:MAG: hypothetical protein AAF203_05500, partial [Pseudomonadota bacterium]
MGGKRSLASSEERAYMPGMLRYVIWNIHRAELAEMTDEAKTLVVADMIRALKTPGGFRPMNPPQSSVDKLGLGVMKVLIDKKLADEAVPVDAAIGAAAPIAAGLQAASPEFAEGLKQIIIGFMKLRGGIEKTIAVEKRAIEEQMKVKASDGIPDAAKPDSLKYMLAYEKGAYG